MPKYNFVSLHYFWQRKSHKKSNFALLHYFFAALALFLAAYSVSTQIFIWQLFRALNFSGTPFF